MIHRASPRQRFYAAVVFVCVVLVLGFLALAACGKIDLERLMHPCGFKQEYGLPCPTCGITTAAVTFVQGRIFESFYIQPAGALLCCLLVFAAFFALMTAAFGIYFDFVERLLAAVKLKYLILALVIIIGAGWMVTLARALAARS